MVALALSASTAMADGGNGAPPGPHYNLNIIGVDKGLPRRRLQGVCEEKRQVA
jgi:hypothetical protein